MRILAFLVVWGKKVGRSFALYHRARLTLVPLYPCTQTIITLKFCTGYHSSCAGVAVFSFQFLLFFIVDVTVVKPDTAYVWSLWE